MPVAMLTGFTGQDGSYLAELLLEKGYDVHAIVRRGSAPDRNPRVAHLLDRVTIHSGDLTDALSIDDAVIRAQPDEFYNLGAQSHVGTSFKQPYLTTEVVGIGTVHCLEALRKYRSTAKFYQASSSEMFGSEAPPQAETTRFHPRSPYAVAKTFAHHMTVHYREAYGMFACCGICFNHESERRGEEFVTRKITQAAARIKLGLQVKLQLGDITPKRDWGYAPEYVDAMWRMLQQPQPDDYVLATGIMRSVREFLTVVFNRAGLSLEKHVAVDCQQFQRPTEVSCLQGSATKAQMQLGWSPRVDMVDLAVRMYEHDLLLEQKRAV